MVRLSLAAVILVVLALSLVPGFPVRGEEPEAPAPKVPPGLAAALENRQGAFQVAEQKYRQERVAAQNAYLEELHLAFRSAMEAYDLDAANAIDRARKAAEWELAQLKDPGKAPPIQPEELAGTWTVRHSHWRGDVVLYPDGRMGRPSWGEKHRDEGTWTYEDGVLTLQWKGWGAETFEPRSCFVAKLATMVRVEPD